MTDWQTLAASATPAEPRFPDCAITALGHLGQIRVSGADTRTFLQGQLTNDINKVTADAAQLSSYCSPKGRMLGSFLIFQRDEDLYLQLPLERLPAILKRLSMFVLRAQVKIEDASAALPTFGLSGECATSLLARLPDDDWGSLTDQGTSVIRVPGDRPRFIVAAPPDQLAELWSASTAQAEVSGADFWSLMDVRAGIPGVYEETVEAFVPQMANLQLVNGVSFTKGCYTGQEVVARMQYLGKLKRRMYRVQIPATEAPARGTELYSPSSDSGQGTGRIVLAAPAPEGGVEALAVMQICSAEAGDVRLGDDSGPAVQLMDLPYAFDKG